MKINRKAARKAAVDLVGMFLVVVGVVGVVLFFFMIFTLIAEMHPLVGVAVIAVVCFLFMFVLGYFHHLNDPDCQ